MNFYVLVSRVYCSTCPSFVLIFPCQCEKKNNKCATACKRNSIHIVYIPAESISLFMHTLTNMPKQLLIACYYIGNKTHFYVRLKNYVQWIWNTIHTQIYNIKVIANVYSIVPVPCCGYSQNTCERCQWLKWDLITEKRDTVKKNYVLLAYMKFSNELCEMFFKLLQHNNDIVHIIIYVRSISH